MTMLDLDINLVNPAHHKKEFTYIGDVGPRRPNKLFLDFHDIKDWRDYILSLNIQSSKVSAVHVNAYHVALRMLLLAWVDPCLIKPAELQGLRSLESALTGMYFQAIFERECASKSKLVREEFRPGLGKLLDYMAERDGLDPMLHNASKKQDGSALNIIRNVIAHGNLFNSLPWGGLFESIRDVMEHAYRHVKVPPIYPQHVVDAIIHATPMQNPT